jgi:hypothetical protein
MMRFFYARLPVFFKYGIIPVLIQWVDCTGALCRWFLYASLSNPCNLSAQCVRALADSLKTSYKVYHHETNPIRFIRYLP